MVYLSLGSNMGDRQMLLQLAIGLITYRIGRVKQLSSVVETPAWGFEGDAFFNACVGVETALNPQDVLNELLAIESLLGRERKKAEGYQARTIDLDILFYEDKVIDTEHLNIPHPRMEKRNFVLAPLAEIAPDFKHPVLKQSIRQLVADSQDKANVTSLKDELMLPKRQQFVAIEGNIGVGKTSFTQLLQAATGGTLLHENFFDNPYLADFYQDPETFALKVETAFLEERIQQLTTFFSQKNTRPVIADFSLEKSLLFARQNLSARDFDAYKKQYLKVNEGLPQPDLVLFLVQSVPQLQKNIEKRGRDFEQDISDDYLQKIEAGYLQWKENSSLNIYELNTKGIDFIENPEDFFPLLHAFFCA